MQYSTSNWGRWKPKRGRKVTLKELPAALAAHDRAQAASDEIRKPLGLDPVPENATVVAWRARLAGTDAKPQSVTAASRPVDLGELTNVRRKRDAYQARVNRELAAMIVHLRGTGTSMRSIADALGMTREGAYQFVKRAAA